MSKVATPVALGLVGAATYLVWVGVTGGSVVGELKAALTGDPSYSPPRKPLGDGAGAPSSDTPAAAGPGTAAVSGSAAAVRRYETPTGGFPFDASKLLAGGANPLAVSVTADAIYRFGAGFDGIWGDEDHKTRKSDHNTADATDLRVSSKLQGDAIAAYYVSQASRLGITYLIWWDRIWTPGAGWQPYTGADNHHTHVHVSVRAR